MKYTLLKNVNENKVKLFPKEAGHVCEIYAHKSNSGKVAYRIDFGGCDTPSKSLEHVTKCNLCVDYTINDTDTLEKYFEKLK